MSLDMSYKSLCANIETLPSTWIPGLLSALIARAIEANVFAEGGLVAFVRGTEIFARKRGIARSVVPPKGVTNDASE